MKIRTLATSITLFALLATACGKEGGGGEFGFINSGAKTEGADTVVTLGNQLGVSEMWAYFAGYRFEKHYWHTANCAVESAIQIKRQNLWYNPLLMDSLSRTVNFFTVPTICSSLDSNTTNLCLLKSRLESMCPEDSVEFVANIFASSCE